MDGEAAQVTAAPALESDGAQISGAADPSAGDAIPEESDPAPPPPPPAPCITLRKLAADCIKPVRAVVDSEEEAIELVSGIWTATANQIAASIRVGKSMSLLPLGVLYMNGRAAADKEPEPALVMSELFVLQYGVSVKPGDIGNGPGPSTKPAYSDIAAAAHCPDKGLVPVVLSAMLHRLGELCGQAFKVLLDFKPLGEIRCEQQRVEFVSTRSMQVLQDMHIPSAQRTVQAVLNKRQQVGTATTTASAAYPASLSATTAAALGGGFHHLGAGARDALQFSPRTASGGGLHAGLSPRGVPMTSGMQPASPRRQFRRAAAPATDDLWWGSSSRIPSTGRAHDKRNAATLIKVPSPRGAAIVPSADAGVVAGGGGRELVRNAPAKRQQFPPLLDDFSRTRAAPYGEELFNGSNCGRIGSHYSPLAAMLVWSDQMKSLRWKAPNDRGGRGSQAEDFGSEDAIEREFANEQVVEGSPLAEELLEAGLAKKDFYYNLSRYRFYATEGIKASVVAPLNDVWVRNVIYLVEAEKFREEIGHDGTQKVINEVRAEMGEDYIRASKHAIADYILQDARCRARARVHIVPSPVTIWGSTPFVGIEGTEGGPPQEWRADLANNKDLIVRSLTVYNQSALHLLNLWYAGGYRDMLLVDLPPPAAPLIEIDRFFEKQRTCCQEAVTRLKSQWLSEVCETIRSENLHLGAPSEARFFKGVSVLLSLQLRSMVAQSVDAFTDFLARFSSEECLTPEQVTRLKDVEEREDAFLLIRLESRGNEIHLRDSAERVHEKLLRIYRDFVVALNEMSTPQARMNRESLTDMDRTLWPTLLEEQHITRAEQAVDRVVEANMKNVEMCLHLYDNFAHLLTEEDRIKDFIRDPSRTRDQYLTKFHELKDIEKEVRQTMPNEVRMQMVAVDCSGLNETLCAKANACVDLLLENIVTTNLDRNEKLCKSFESIINNLGRKPTGAGELVELEHSLEVFRSSSLRDLLDEFQDICSWQSLLFDCQHLLQSRDFKAIADSANWVHKIDAQMNQRENDMRNERDIIENRFKQERSKFEEDLQSYSALVNKFKEAGNVKQLEEYLQLILSLKENFERAKVEAQKFREKETMLGWDPSEFEKLTEGIDKLQPYDELWELVHKFQNEEKRWMKGPLFAIQPEAVDQLANNMAKKAVKLQAQFESLQLPTPAGVAKRIKRDLDSFKHHLPLIHALCNPGLQQRHWDQISEVVTFVMERDQGLTLSRVIDMEVGKYITELQEISDSAAREYTLETTLNGMDEAWEQVIFELKAWKDTETYIVAGTTVDEMQGLMDDHIIKAQTMKGSPYAKPFLEKIADIETWLLNTQEVMDLWVKVQSVWLYLEPIFGSEDIVKQMPTEANLFRQVDQSWRSTMQMSKDEGKAKPVSKYPGLLEKLKECRENLDIVQKGLHDYLETKRLAFPRFYFLSDDNLLEILSETKDPKRVNPHMKKAFEGIQSLEFESDQNITAMISSEKERVPFTTPVDPSLARGNVELWLVEVQAAMLETVRDQLLKSAENYAGEKFTDWLKAWPGQVVIAIFCLYWTSDVSQALKNEGNDGVRKYSEKLEGLLVDIIDLVRNDIPKLVRCTLEALIVLFVHNRDTVVDLYKAGVDKEDDFDWLVQLRYYIEDNPEKPQRKDAFVRITNSFLSYAYEYIGNSSRLVVTPLTDRCYRTCCGALHLLYGAAPEGPAGTGKTETVKDLSKALARFCVVFNCSDELDFLAMAKFFKGLAASGGWACFDEFNRIDPEVLSVIAQQILCIQMAIKERKEKFEFEGTVLPIIWTCNCFITMNPGYAGRAELPDNLKALFRTVAMMVPDYAMIAEIKLYAYGYEDSRNLAQKIVTTYKLCSEQLSSQTHYDYGMRAVFAVLVRAGSLKRSQPMQNESILMLQSINDVNLAKFLDFDVPLYTGITKDLFPGVELPKQDYADLINKLTEHLHKDGCSPHPYFVEKIIQFYECHLVRHSVMLVGMPFSGKTTALNMLQRALTDLAQAGTLHEGCVVHQARLNPKSVPAKDLYGAFDDVSHEWSDGIVAVLFREFSRNQTEERKWLVFDGPVDAVWIENMNTVMDENKKLCLNSGEIIAMSPNMRTVIEPMDVEVASPATISRNGMVFFEPHLMGYGHLIDKTLKGPLPEQMIELDKDEARNMVEFLTPPLLKFLEENCKLVSPTQDQNLVQSFLILVKTHLTIGFNDQRYNREQADPKTIASMVDCLAIFSAIWSMGAACETGSRQPFGQHLRKLLSGQVDNIRPFKKFAPPFPERGSVFDYCFSLETTSWVQWGDTVDPQQIPNNAQVEGIIVQTVDNIRYRYILQHCIDHRVKLLFCGPTGTGKTVYMQQAIMNLTKDMYTQLLTGFSAQTNCGQTQDLFDAKLERRRKGIFGPPAGKIMVAMVDDLNMPVKETYGAQPPIELLRQGIDSIAYPPTGGWFERKDVTHPLRSIIDVLLFAAMGTPGGGRTFVTPRLLAHFCLIGFPLLDDDNMTQIFSTILDWKFKVDAYPTEVCGMTKKLVQASLEIYKNTASELLPTPLKVHYTFNLRDFAKVIHGVLLLKKTECQGEAGHVRLWAHEILRVIGDRLIDDTDRMWMLTQLRDSVKKNFQMSFDEVFQHLDSDGDGKVDRLEEIRTLFFGDLLSPPGIPKRPYAECPDVAALQREVEIHLQQHNDMSSKPMDLVCFLYMLEHLSRIARVIKTPGGNALLVGLGGSGRQSCTRLACFLADFTVFQIEIVKGYGMDAFREDMQKMMKRAGGEAEKTVFLFSDTQIKNERFVEDINNLLNTGEIPNLFPADEKAAVCEMVRNAAKEAGKAPDGTPMQLFTYFVELCRANLSIVVCLSPIGDSWRTRLRQFNSLVNCCTIDWFTPWPQDALLAVATRFLKTVPDLDEQVRTACVEMCQAFHSDTKVLAKRFQAEHRRFYYSTPTSYLELIQTFKHLLQEKRSSTGGLRSKYEVGLEKLTTTEQSVEGMKQDLIALQPQLVSKNEEVGEMMIVVNEESAKTEKVKEVVAADEAVASEAASKANAIKEECEKDLGEAMPALNEALKALDTLSAKEIAEIKAMKSPPAPVRLVLSAVCVLRNIKPVRVKDDAGKMVDDYWPAAVKMISEMGFLQSLQIFDKDNIAPAIIQKVATYTSQADFQPDRVERVSRAAWGLCMWVRAMEVYDRVAKVVAPKQESLRAAEAEYGAVMDDLTEKRNELQKVVDELQSLNEKLDGLKKEQDDLTYQVDLCKKKLDRAETLIASLGGEKTRWTQNAKDLSEDYIHLTGDVIVASGLIAYLGAFTPDFREEAILRWAELAKTKAIPGSPEFGLQRCLGEPVKVRAWIIAGLPNDSFSIENGIIIDKAHRWPLCIDPQSQANRWIKKMGQSHQIVVSKFTDGDYLKRLEGCIQFGHPMLVENLGEETDPAVEPVLLRQTFKKGNTHMIKLGEAIIEWNSDFKFYLTTKLRNPHYLPEVAVKVTLLNFMITQVGLQDQLLNIVVERERPDLAEEKARLVIESAENKDQLEVTENKILNVLSASSGNLLEDEAAVQVLSTSKQLSNQIAEKQTVAEETERQIDEARMQYVPVASKTSILFFCIADLANIDPMYQYSLLFFINLFKVSIDKSDKAEEIEERIEILNSFFMEMLYNNICRSLFERDKLLFSFLLTVRLGLTKQTVRMSDYRFLLTGGVSLEEPPPKPADWIPDRLWGDIFRLSRSDEVYIEIQATFADDEVAWKEVYDAPEPLKVLADLERQPRSVQLLDRFQQLLVLRCVRPDRVVPAILRYVADSIGEKFTRPPPFDLQGSYADSSPTAPLIFILSPGSDPFSALNMFASEKGKQVTSISLGQGQGPKAERLMEEAMTGGWWVLLQNCHLATSWMPKLDKKLELLDPKEVHHDFRLWLSSYPSIKFPVSILQSSVKITNEAPKGLRANLIGSFLMDPISNEDFFENCATPEIFKRLLYALCFFHAVIQERRTFGPLGWNIPYEFTQNDLRISVRQLRMFLDESTGEVPFKALRYLTGECNYGGRVTDDKDRRLIITLLNDYYCSDALEEGHSLCEEHQRYVIPWPEPYEAMLEEVKGVPLDDPPGVFGFHPNANLTREQNETYGMMDNLLKTVGSSSSGGGSSAEETIGEVAADILGRMPPPWKLAEVQEKYPTMYEESMNTVLIQELTRFNGLIQVIVSSLQDIQKAIKGLLLMSQQLETVFNSILDGKTPQLWLSKSYPSLKPLGSYTNDLIERLKFFQAWVDEGIPVIFWLSGIYFTQAFTTGAAQNYARRYTIPIDTLTFDFDFPVDQQPTTRPDNGVYTYGVFLEGCKWDWDEWELAESDPKVLFVPVPMIWIVPCKKEDQSNFPCYTCPLYKVSSRKGVLLTTGHSTNFVMSIRLPSSMPEAHWVKRGVAMIASLDN